MRRYPANGAGAWLLSLMLAAPGAPAAGANGPGAPYPVSSVQATNTLTEVLTPGRWAAVENSVDRALGWIAGQQAEDGSFPAMPAAQPAVTSLCVLAFLARGHQPGLGPYGARMERAIDFVLSCQREDGLFSFQPPTNKEHVDMTAIHTAVYNHAISGLMLGEVFGHVTGPRTEAVKAGMTKALQFTHQLQTRPKAHAADAGGWRYLRLRYDSSAADSDLSVTAWQILFLRSARNAEFNVPQSYVDGATEFVHRCWDEKKGVFNYALEGAADVRSSRGMVGAGIVCLSLAGQHQTPQALRAGDWLLAHPCRKFGELVGTDDNFFYSTYYCSQAAAQLGGSYWKGIYEPLAEALLAGQRGDGSWPPEPQGTISRVGNVYTTAMAVLSLTPPYQLLPVYQR
jgi:prenyltransferase beta subunit